MPKMTFTDRGLRALKPKANRVDYWSKDAHEPGFGLRVFPSGTRSWFQYTRKTKGRTRTTKDGSTVFVKAVRVTLGTFPDMGLAEAREAAADARADVRHGENPADERREEREAQRQTVRALYEAYEQHSEERHERGEFRSWGQVERSLRPVLKKLGHRPVSDIKRRDIAALLDAKAKHGATAANRLRAHISGLFSYGRQHDWLEINPASGLRRRPEQERRRVLTDDELRGLWTFLASEKPIELARGKGKVIVMPADTGRALKDLFKLMLWTGQRIAETSRMKWVDVDLDAKVWTVPASEAKNRREHVVPLNEAAVGMLKARQETAQPGVVWVFPSSSVKRAGSVLVWSQRFASAVCRAIGGEPWRAHDLRRTCASRLGDMGVFGDTIDAILNHSRPGMLRVYDHGKREAAKADALSRWSVELTRIVTAAPGKVLAFKA